MVTSGYLYVYEADVLESPLPSHNEALSMGHLTDGLYFYRVINNAQVLGTGKLMVKR